MPQKLKLGIAVYKNKFQLQLDYIKFQHLQLKFNSGSGYVLSRGAIKLLVEKQFPLASQCPEKSTGSDDVEIAQCLANEGILVEVTSDAMGKSRFHHQHFSEIYNAKVR